MADKTLSEIVAYELERIAFEGAVFSEATVTLQVHPLTFLQLIAWSGVAYLDEHEILRIVDWRCTVMSVSEDLLVRRGWRISENHGFEFSSPVEGFDCNIGKVLS